MGIPEDLKAVAIQRVSMKSERKRLEFEWKDIQKVGSCGGRSIQWGACQDMKRYRKEGRHPNPHVQARIDRIKEIGVLLEASKVREQGLIDKWNTEKHTKADAVLRKELAREQAGLKREQRKAQARGGHPEYGLSATFRPPPRRAKSGVQSRYAAPKRRSTPRPRKIYRPPQRSR